MSSLQHLHRFLVIAMMVFLILIVCYYQLGYTLNFVLFRQLWSATNISNISNSTCKRIHWFTYIGERSYEYEAFALAAIQSARKYSPSLIPHLIYSSSSQPNPFTKRWNRLGGVVHFHNLSFMDLLKTTVIQKKQSEFWLTQWGAFLRFDAARLFVDTRLDTQFYQHNAVHEYILTTDTDVLFQNDINSCTAPVNVTSLVVQYGPEGIKDTIHNTGVLFLHVLRWLALVPDLVEFGNRGSWYFDAYDQGLLNEYHKQHRGIVTRLPNSFNYKGYWGQSTSSIFILHFHGPKPHRGIDSLVLEKKNDPRYPYYNHLGNMALRIDNATFYGWVRTQFIQMFEAALNCSGAYQQGFLPLEQYSCQLNG